MIDELRALMGRATPGPYDAFAPDMVRAVREDIACPLFDVREPWGEFAEKAPTVRNHDGSVLMRANCEGAKISAALRQQHANCAYLLALLNAAPDLLDRIERMEGALRQCADQFQFYANEHTAAGKTEKAATNQRFADLTLAALQEQP